MASEVQLALTAARLAAGLLEQGAVAVGLPPNQARAHHDDHGAVERAPPSYHRPPGHAGQPACQLGAHLCCRWLGVCGFSLQSLGRAVRLLCGTMPFCSLQAHGQPALVHRVPGPGRVAG